MRDSLSNKKPLVIVIAVGLIILTALLIYSILMVPVRQPYRDALSQLNNTNTALARTNVAINSNDASTEDFKKSIDTAQTTFISLEKENEALGKMAVLQDGEGKKLYIAYDEDLKAYATYTKNVLESMQKVRPVLFNCSATMENVTLDAQGATVIRTCATEMEAASDVPDADYKLLAATFHENYDQLAIVLERMGGISDTNSAEYKSLSTQRDQIVQNLSDAGTTFSENVKERRQEILSTDSAKALSDYLTDESRVF